MSDEDFLRRTFELALQAKAEQCAPFGAIVVKDGVIVGEGYNRVLALQDPTHHGELAAIRDACHKLGTADLSGCTVYASGEPCPMCAGAIAMAKISRLVYGAPAREARWNGFPFPLTHDQMALPLLSRALPTSQLLVDEANAVYS